MAFPFLSEENFEDAGGQSVLTASADILAATHFDAHSDVGGIMSIAQFAEIARVPRVAMPYSGAYALRFELAGGTTDATLQEDTAWDTAASGTIYHRFMLWFGGPNFAMANTDEFAVFRLIATATTEVACGLQYTDSAGYRLYLNETETSTGALLTEVYPNRWYSVEVESVIDSGVGNDGTIQLWVDGQSVGTKPNLDQGPITHGQIGVIGPDAGTTATVLFDSVIADDARIYPPSERFSETVTLTKSGHVMLSHGQLKNATLLCGANADNRLEVFDTNVGDDTDFTNSKLELYGTTASSEEVIDPAGVPIHMRHGAYVKLSGTADANGPRAKVQICPDTAYGSDGSIRNYGARL